jgi:hypothetical protein
MTNKNTSPLPKCNRTIKLDLYKYAEKENLCVTAIYNKQNERHSIVPKKEPFANILQFHRNKFNSRDLPPVVIKNHSDSLNNSRNNRYLHPKITQKTQKKMLFQPNESLQGRVLKHKTLNDLRKKNFHISAFSVDQSVIPNAAIERPIEVHLPLREVDLNCEFKSGTKWQKKPISIRTPNYCSKLKKPTNEQFDINLFNLEPSNENITVNKVYESSAKERPKKMIHCLSKPVIKNTKQTCFLSMQKQDKKVTSISEKSNTGFKIPHKLQPENIRKSQAIEEAYNSYISKAFTSKGDRNESDFNTKATSSCLVPSVRKVNYHRESEINVEPIFELFDEENKENDEKLFNSSSVT